MTKYPGRLHRLAEEYRRMSRLQGFTHQSRGQRLDSFFADVLECWGIDARPGPHRDGHVDITFQFRRKHFVAECKWEKDPVDTGQISKLQKRVRQRLAGTIGVFLSMSGFSRDSLEDLKEGERLEVLLISRKHLEAMVAGFAEPRELFDQMLGRASFTGEAYVSLESLFGKTIPAELNVSFQHPPGLDPGQIVQESVPGFGIQVIASNLSYGQSGVVGFSNSSLLITLSEGIYELDCNGKKLKTFFPMRDCSSNPLVTLKGEVFMVRHSGIGRVRDEEFEIVAGGLCGNKVLLQDRSGEVWVFSNGLSKELEGARPAITRVGDSIGSEERHEVEYDCGSGMNAASMPDGRFVIIGNRGLVITDTEGNAEKRDIEFTNPGGLVKLSDDTLLIASDPCRLTELDLKTGRTKEVARLRLQGAHELCRIDEQTGYLFSHYSDVAGKRKGILIEWQY